MKHPILYAITDTRQQQRFSHVELVRMAVQAGVDTVQVREKRRWHSCNLRQLFHHCANACMRQSTQLVINDHVSIAAELRSEGFAVGAHVGSTDLSAVQARALLGPAALLGATVNNHQQLAHLQNAPVNYIGIGPVFKTYSKENPAPVLGIAGLKQLVQQSHAPVIAIGGITLDNVAEVLSTGVTGVAIVSSWVLAKDPVQALYHFKTNMRDSPCF